MAKLPSVIISRSRVATPSASNAPLAKAFFKCGRSLILKNSGNTCLPMESIKNEDFRYKLPPLIAAIKCPNSVLAISARNITGTLAVANLRAPNLDNASIEACWPILAALSIALNSRLTV